MQSRVTEKFARRLIWSVVLMMVAGCATRPALINGATGVNTAEALQHWTASGRLGVSGVEQAGSGAFTWQQRSTEGTLDVRGPVGSGALHIITNGEVLNMQASDGAQYDAEQVLQELELRLGAAVPIRQLRYWLLGLAAPGSASRRELSDVLEQDGWRIAYSEWAQRGQLRLPTRMIMTHQQLRVVMVIQRWQLES